MFTNLINRPDQGNAGREAFNKIEELFTDDITGDDTNGIQDDQDQKSKAIKDIRKGAKPYKVDVEVIGEVRPERI